jgi:hypothetical protein
VRVLRYFGGERKRVCRNEVRSWVLENAPPALHHVSLNERGGRVLGGYGFMMPMSRSAI